jgi:ribose 5-phosphate isomerase B
MDIVIGSDHAGLSMKAAIVSHLNSLGHKVVDKGTHTADSIDYPDYAKAVADSVTSGEASLGVLICGTGQGMSMAANKVNGIRSAVVSDAFSARAVREHNNANVLCLGQRVIGEGLALDLVDAFITQEFAGGRHERRVNKIIALEQG